MSEVATLVQRHLPAARAGDRRAFSALVAATQGTVASIALAIVRDVQYSEDVAQEVYLTVWSKLDELRNDDSFLPWLREMTRNRARDFLRCRRARPGDEPNADPDAALAQLAAADRTADSVEVDERRRALDEAFEELPPDAREVLTLYYREGESTAQVAALLGLRPATVRQRLSRARKALTAGVERALANDLVRTAPGAAFTAAFAGLLTTASPPAAAAAVAMGLGSKSILKLAATAGLGLAFALLGGIAGVVFGIRPHLKTAFDERERLELLAHRRKGIIAVVAAVLGFAVSPFVPGPWWPIAVFVLFFSAIAWQTMVAIPKTLARRLAHERAVDPAAEARHRRQRIWCWVGLVGGGLSGFGGLIVGLVSSGRLPLG
ncbi:sigma-70 family RNA polymerase sigma factor [Wenzhouxiangella sp. XN79A]|uniref:RNA polymerase sigma factor n=1 Tax=Wenzhouxiangella sp. XN79A TaxID=2724193 RepID=UPI00144AFA7C|nr:sigma-70 family RNA polymerase sigma factor [Wenzhouxiangella sp. XN79A]NKI33620.1 sigma-70 family RNA polymerase sigma factor [Wenzhouxiangella sp. XN79A]